MAISASDIKFKLAIKTGSAGNSAAQPDPDESLGKYISTTELSGTALNNLFDDMSGSENAGETAEYRCVFVHNAHGSLTLTDAKLYLSGGDPAGGADVALAVDTTAASAIGSASAQALEATTAYAPGAPITGLSYSAPSTAGEGLDLGDIDAGDCKAFWVRRTGADTSAVTPETATLAVSGNTAA